MSLLLTQLAYVLLFYCSGMVILANCLPETKPYKTLISTLALPIGLSFFVISIAFCLVIPDRFAKVTLAVGMLALLATFTVHALRTTRLLNLLISPMLGILVFATVIFHQLNITVLSYDSFFFLQQSQFINHYQSLVTPGITTPANLASYPIFMSIVHALTLPFSQNFFWSIQPIIAIVFIGCFFTLMQLVQQQLDLKSGVNLLYSALFTLALFSSYFMIFQFFYVNGNLASALYIFLFLTLSYYALVTDKDCWLIPAFIALTAFMFLRIESPLFASLFLICLVGVKGQRSKLLSRLLLSHFVITVSWFGFLSIYAPSGILSFIPAVTMISGLAAVNLYYFFFAGRMFPFVNKEMPVIIMSVMLILLLGCYALKTAHIHTSYNKMLANMRLDWWGWIWIFVLSFGPLLACLKRRLPYEQYLSMMLPLFVFSLIVVSFFRATPYRLGWGDSGNRMLTHILPVAMFYISIKSRVLLETCIAKLKQHQPSHLCIGEVG